MIGRVFALLRCGLEDYAAAIRFPVRLVKIFRKLSILLVAIFFFATRNISAVEILQIGKSRIHVDIATNLPVSDAALLDWVQRTANAVTNYLGRFPTDDLTIQINRGGRGSISGGVTYGAKLIKVRIGRRAQPDDLKHDWILTHEMFHLAFPTLDDRYKWMMEGLSDYLEPVARARTGQLPVEEVWRGWCDGFPKGQPKPGDEGLDNTPTWGRTYWGGSIFWLMADVEIREKTKNRYSVDDAIRAILKDGGNGDAAWALDRVIKVGDHATKTTVLDELHKKFGERSEPFDIAGLLKKLGVNDSNNLISFDDTAPDAAIRKAITAARFR